MRRALTTDACPRLTGTTHWVTAGGTLEAVTLTVIETAGTRVLAGHTGAVNSVAFSPDGKTLATADHSGTAELWDVGFLVDVLARLCSQVGGSLTHDEWAHYVPTGPPYRNVCAQHS